MSYSPTIYKFPLAVTDEQVLTLPVDRYYPHLGLDPNGRPCVWVQADFVNDEQEDVVLHVVGTGAPLPIGSFHIGSFVAPPFVWHVYEQDNDDTSSVPVPKFIGEEV